MHLGLARSLGCCKSTEVVSCAIQCGYASPLPELPWSVASTCHAKPGRCRCSGRCSCCRRWRVEGGRRLQGQAFASREACTWGGRHRHILPAWPFPSAPTKRRFLAASSRPSCRYTLLAIRSLSAQAAQGFRACATQERQTTEATATLQAVHHSPSRHRQSRRESQRSRMPESAWRPPPSGRTVASR